MPRHSPPDHRDPQATAGLRQRRQEQGLPTGRVDGEQPQQGCSRCGDPFVKVRVGGVCSTCELDIAQAVPEHHREPYEEAWGLNRDGYEEPEVDDG